MVKKLFTILFLLLVSLFVVKPLFAINCPEGVCSGCYCDGTGCCDETSSGHWSTCVCWDSLDDCDVNPRFGYAHCGGGPYPTSGGCWFEGNYVSMCVDNQMWGFYCFGCNQGCPCVGGGGCFTPGTEVQLVEGNQEIQTLQEGDEVISFDPESDSEVSGIVEKVHEVSQSAYYKVKTKDGQELEVTGEHPLWAIQKEEARLTFWEYLKTESLTKKLLMKFGNMLK